jgi:tetratricopeptide (TPR) repeat protein
VRAAVGPRCADSNELGDPLSEGLAAAERALGQAVADPQSALDAALGLLANQPGPETAAVAARAAGVAELHLGRRSAARQRLSSARDAAVAHGLGNRAAELQLALAVALLQDELPLQALHEMDCALERAEDSATLGKVQSQRATILMRVGRTEEALDQSVSALENCQAAGLTQSVAQLKSNRGVAYAYLGEFALAEGELREAHTLLEQLGSKRTAAQVLHNLGFVAGRQGDIPRALSCFDESLSAFAEIGVPADVSPVDRCEVLLSARLLPEARGGAESAVSALSDAGLFTDLAEARLMLAEIALQQGDYESACDQAEAAAVAFARQSRPGWECLARFTSARGRWASAGEPGAVVAEAIGLVPGLEAAGWTAQALECRIHAARAALRLRDNKLAETIAAAAARRAESGTWHERSRAAYAAGLAALAAGNQDAALASLADSMMMAAQHADVLGATELRAMSAAAAAEPAELGLQLALYKRDPELIFAWAEITRARALWTPRARPPRDPELAARLSGLRHTISALEKSIAGGQDDVELRSTRRRLEDAIRESSLRAAPTTTADTPRNPQLADVMTALDGRTLVEFIESEGDLKALVVSGVETTLVDLCPTSDVARHGAGMRFGLARLAAGRDSAGSLQAAASVLKRSAKRADELLVHPLLRLLPASDGSAGASSSTVIVPTGALHALPWALLPSMAERAFVIVPSTTMWLDLIAREAPAGAGDRQVVLVAGPDLASAPDEITAIAEHYEAPLVLRSDNPLFSSLSLYDGPLTVYDLETLASYPRLIVLSSCDAGRADVRPGDALLGTSASLLSMGVSTVVSSVAPVSDAVVPEVMRLLHTQLRRGQSTAEALAKVRRSHSVANLSPGDLAARTRDSLRALLASSWICFGADSGMEQPAAPAMRGSQLTVSITK